MTTVLDDFKPADFGFHQFADFRQIQREAIEQAVYEPERFQGIAPPTGSGKSLIAVAIHKLTGWRTAVLTATKGLQNQYTGEFAKAGMIDIRGKANYRCQDMKQMHCADGMRAGCRYLPPMASGCSYADKKQLAKSSKLLVTNYAYWLNVNDRTPEGLMQKWEGGDKWPRNPFQCLILDEAHAAPDELANYLAVRLYEKDLKDLIGKEGIRTDDLRKWVECAANYHREADIQFVNMQRILAKKGSQATGKELAQAAKLESLVDKLAQVKGINPKAQDWVCEYREGHPKFGRSWEFDIIWPGRYAEQYLFCGIERVILMSATLRPKTMHLLGIKDSESQFREWPRIFPANRNPIYYVPARKKTAKGDFTAVQLKYTSSDSDLQLVVAQVDRIIEGRRDRKGLIQTVAYHRQEYLFKHSRFTKFMIGNTNDPDSETASEVCRAFRSAPAGSGVVLVSPSFSTGWDFPYSECEYIIIVKIPFVPTVSKIMKARQEKDPRYPDYLAMQELVQSSGRGMRAADDRCEVFIVDGSLDWFLTPNRSLAPSWFEPAVQRLADIPLPPVRVRKEILETDDVPF